MELCSSATTPTFLKFKASLLCPTHSFISPPGNSTLAQLIKNTISFTFIKHVILTTNLPSRQFKKISKPFEASASTGEVDTLVQKLPADLNVTETNESSSRKFHLLFERIVTEESSESS